MSAASSVEVAQEPLSKMQYLIRRRPGVTRDELIAHWFANHMPQVASQSVARAAQGKVAAKRYMASLFDPGDQVQPVWDGVAQLWWDQPLPVPDEPHGTRPADTFQEKAEPYVPWATTEYIVLDGSDRLTPQPNTLNDPFPCTRSGFFKVTTLITLHTDADFAAFAHHWLSVHGPNGASVMGETGGFRYTISMSDDPESAPYAGMAEQYFDDAKGATAFNDRIEPDGMARWIAGATRLVTTTEMIGIA